MILAERLRPTIDRLVRRVDSAVSFGNAAGNTFARLFASLFPRKR